MSGDIAVHYTNLVFEGGGQCQVILLYTTRISCLREGGSVSGDVAIHYTDLVFEGGGQCQVI